MCDTVNLTKITGGSTQLQNTVDVPLSSQGTIMIAAAPGDGIIVTAIGSFTIFFQRGATIISRAECAGTSASTRYVVPDAVDRLVIDTNEQGATGCHVTAWHERDAVVNPQCMGGR